MEEPASRIRHGNKRTEGTGDVDSHPFRSEKQKQQSFEPHFRQHAGPTQAAASLTGQILPALRRRNVLVL